MSNAKLLLKRSAQEAGLDDRHLTTLEEITHPPLFPDILWHSSGRRRSIEEEIAAATEPPPIDPTSTAPPAPPELVVTRRPPNIVYMINKQREINEALQQSSMYVMSEPPEIAMRLSYKRKRRERPDVEVLESIGHRLSTDARYFPAELLVGLTSTTTAVSGTIRTKRTSSLDVPRKLEELEQRERARSGSDPKQPPAPDDDLAEPEPEPEEDEIEDYTTNYYESEEESEGEQGEATF